MKKLIYQNFFKFLIITGAFFMFASTAFAAANDYAVAGGDIATLPVVGATASTINSFMLTDAGGDDFAAAEQLQVTINTVKYPNVTFDSTVTSLIIGGTCNHNEAGSVVYSSNNQVATFTVFGGGSACVASSTITVTGMKVRTLYAEVAPGADELIDVDNKTTASGTPIDSSSTMNVATTAAVDATAAITFGANSVVGTAGVTTITLTTPFALDQNDTIDITFPAYVDITGNAEVATGTFDNEDAATISCDDAAQVLTCTVTNNASTLATGTIILQNITTKYVGSTDITVFEVEDEGVDANNIVVESTVELTNATAAVDATAAITFGNNATVGTAGETTITLTTPFALDQNDTIDITFPNYVDISGDAEEATGTFDNLNEAIISCDDSAQVLTCTITNAGATLTTGTIILQNITTKYTGSTDITVFEVEDEGDANNNIVVESTVELTNVAAAVDATAAITFGNNTTVGTAGVTTITLTTPFALDQNDTIDITFPAYVDITGNAEVATGTFDNEDAATISCDDAAQVLTCTVTNNASTLATGTIILQNITTNYLGSTDITVFEVEDEGSADNNIVVETTVALTNVTTANALELTNVEPLTLISGVESRNTISFTTTVTIPNLGRISVTYPSGWGVGKASGVTATSLSGLDGTWTATVSGQVVTLTQTGGTASTAGVKSLIIPQGIIVTSATGSGGTYTITTEIASGDDIETDASVTADTIQGGQSSSSDPSDGLSSSPLTPAEDEEAASGDDAADESVGDEAAAEESAEDEGAADEGAEDEGAAAEEPAVEPITITTESGESVTLTDVSEHWADTEIEVMTSKEIVKGNPDGSFKPDNSLNRAEAAALLYRVLGLEEPSAPTEKPFSDVEVDSWYAGYVSELKAKELVNGNPDGTYKPEVSINRAEFLTLAMNVYYYITETEMDPEIAVTDAFVDLKTDAWYAQIVSAAYELKFVNGSACRENTCFNAEKNITRAEATVILYNIFIELL